MNTHLLLWAVIAITGGCFLGGSIVWALVRHSYEREGGRIDRVSRAGYRDGARGKQAAISVLQAERDAYRDMADYWEAHSEQATQNAYQSGRADGYAEAESRPRAPDFGRPLESLDPSLFFEGKAVEAKFADRGWEIPAPHPLIAEAITEARAGGFDLSGLPEYVAGSDQWFATHHPDPAIRESYARLAEPEPPTDHWFREEMSKLEEWSRTQTEKQIRWRNRLPAWKPEPENEPERTA